MPAWEYMTWMVPAAVQADRDGAVGVGGGRSAARSAGREPAVRQLGGVQPGALRGDIGMTEREFLIEMRRALKTATDAIEKRLDTLKHQQERTKAA